jgi:hypothetical protein
MSKHKFPPGTRIRTPSGRFARVQKYDDEGRVHVFYYDVEPGEEGLFPAKLLEPCDIIKPANTHVTADPKGGSGATIHEFWATRAVEKYR